MQHQQELEQRLFEMEQVAQAFRIEPFDLFLLGGAACLLAGYTARATRDFDLLDMDYAAPLAKVLVLLRDYDLLEYSSTLIAPSYRARCKRLSQFTYLHVFVLSAEDIIVSKLIRMNERDLEDLDAMMPQADHALLLQIIDEVLMRDDLYEIKKKGLRKNLDSFKERYHVQDSV